MMDEVELRGALGYEDGCYETVIDLMAKGWYPTDGWVEHIPWSGLIDEGFAPLRRGERMKVMVGLPQSSRHRPRVHLPGPGPRLSRVSTVSGVEVPSAVLELPRLRGRVHQAAFVVSLLGLAWLVVLADGTREVIAAAVYGLAMVLLYFVSS